MNRRDVLRLAAASPLAALSPALIDASPVYEIPATANGILLTKWVNYAFPYTEVSVRLARSAKAKRYRVSALPRSAVDLIDATDRRREDLAKLLARD